MINILEVSAMNFIQTEEKGRTVSINRLFGISFLVILLVGGGSVSCKQKRPGETPQEEQEGTVVKKGVNEFEGKVTVGVGKYFYIPGAQGIDMVVQGIVESGDASTLVEKEVRVKGEFSPERPSLLAVDTIEIKEGDKKWRNVFTRTEGVVLEDYLDSKTRDEFKPLQKVDYRKNEDWEGKEKVKIYGKLEKTTAREGGVEKGAYSILMLDESQKELGKILIDNFTDFAQYYLKKLRLFDNLWFYLKVKETVDLNVRKKTKELFHAEVLFAGLF